MGKSGLPRTFGVRTLRSFVAPGRLAVVIYVLIAVQASAQLVQQKEKLVGTVTTTAVSGLMKAASQPVRVAPAGDGIEGNLTARAVKGLSLSTKTVTSRDQANSTQLLLTSSPGMTIMPGTGPSGGYLSLSAFGIPPIGGMGDTTFVNFNVPPFKWAGKMWTRIGVTSDGYVVIGGATGDTPSNSFLPNPTAPHNILAPFWTDLNPAMGGGAVRIGTLTDGAHTWVVIDWNSVFNASLSGMNTFEIWLRLGGTEEVTFSYNTVTNGNAGSLTIGAQDSTGIVGAVWYMNGTGGPLPSHNELVVKTATFSSNQTSLNFGDVVESQSRLDSVKVNNPAGLPLQIISLEILGSTPSQFSASPGSATINPGDSLTFQVIFSPTSPGPKSANLLFHHNGPGSTWTVSLSGNGLTAAAGIVSVSDLPFDQGGTVVVNWNKSPVDFRTSTIVTAYWVWRGISVSSVPGGATVLDREGYAKYVAQQGPVVGTFMSTEAHRSQANLAGPVYWQYITSLPSHGLDHYSFASPTLADSTPQGIPWRYFFITAATNDPNTYWDSAPDSGYSVDNIAPLTPAAAMLNPLASGLMQVSWNRDRTDPDVGHYDVYRSTSDGFSIGPSTLLKSTTDTTVFDSTAVAGQTYYYRVTTVDIHGNQSIPTIQLGNTALALELASFSGTSAGSDVVILSWTTATETDVYGFTVERRQDNELIFLPVPNGFLAGNGTSSVPHTYTFRDQLAPIGLVWYRVKETDNSGTSRYSAPIEVQAQTVELAPKVFQLMQNYPNPFNPSTDVKFSVATTASATVEVYNTVGQRVTVLFDGVAQAGQFYRATLNGTNLASGLYFARLQSGNSVATRKMLLLK